MKVAHQGEEHPEGESQRRGGARHLLRPGLIPKAQIVGDGGIDADAGAHRQGDHQELQGVDDGEGREPGVRVPAHEEAVHDVVEGLDQLGQHHRRRKVQQDAAHPLRTEIVPDHSLRSVSEGKSPPAGAAGVLKSRKSPPDGGLLRKRYYRQNPVLVKREFRRDRIPAAKRGATGGPVSFSGQTPRQDRQRSPRRLSQTEPRPPSLLSAIQPSRRQH